MKLREKIKRFWTLDVHNHEGFTLVELIIVIAILAILSSVAVVGYSSYIKKANMQADKTLVADIAHALTLHYYSVNSKNNLGYVIIAPNGVTVTSPANDFGNAAMVAAFGSNWATSLKLKYNDWESGLLDTIIKQNGRDDNPNLGGSSFLQGSSTTELLEDVSEVTNAALLFVTSRADDREALYESLCSNFCGSPNNYEEFNALCKRYNIKVVQNPSSGKWAIDESVSDTELTNFMVMASASNFADAKESIDATGEADPTPAVLMVTMYAMCNAYINSEYATENDIIAYNNMVESMNSATSLGDVTTAINNFTGSVENWDDYEADTETFSNDQNSFMNIMEALDSVSGTVDVSQSDLFSPNGQIAKQFDAYVSVTELFAGVDIPEGAVVVIINENGVIECSCAALLP